MTFAILKGWHYSLPPVFGLFWKKKKMVRELYFDYSSKYFLNIEDAGDVNKLFGLGYFPGHHSDSARVGWNYVDGKIRLYAYCYVDGKRIIEQLAEVDFHTWVKVILEVKKGIYFFRICDPLNDWYYSNWCEIPFTHKKKFSYRLGCYFGGNKTAPHTIKIKIKC